MYLTLAEAYEQAEDNDIIRREGKLDTIEVFKSAIMEKFLSVESALSNDWQIIKKKQEPVTAEEASSAFMDKDGWAKASTYKQAFIKGFNISAKNERLYYAELVELLEEYANSGVGEYPRNFEDRMVNAFNKIKKHEAE